ncbi:MAG: hypothetical protein ICV78_25255 [Tolypothrix sp. Co-bin9]|nr:hypothetical protein [Tolypothrix sp. Co-bin9]
MSNTTVKESGSFMNNEDWFNLGKSDAWAGKPKTPRQQDVEAASMYELGYSEGEIKHPPTQTPLAQQ